LELTQAEPLRLPAEGGEANPARPGVPRGPYLVVGLGRAGRAAVEALAARFGAASVRAWDDASADRMRPVRASLRASGIKLTSDAMASLTGVGAVVKSPGVALDHPLLSQARRRGIPILDELELGWRLAPRPVVAVTGTNGKSTTAALVAAALDAAGRDPIVCGNSLYGPALSAVPAEHDGWLVAEVSSYQAEGCPEFLPSAAVFTNLTRDHLHRHGSMAAYGSAKRRLFVRGQRAVPLAVLNGDDAFGRRLAEEVGDRGGRTATYGCARQADYRIRGATWSVRGGMIHLDTPIGRIRMETRLPGAHNAANMAAAIALADELGLAREPTLEALATMPPLPGRFEPVDAARAFDVVVDFAHTPDGVVQAVATAREIAARRRTRVIATACAVLRGERRTREEIGRVARAAADHLILCGSSLNGEPPLVNLAELLAGARGTDGGMLEVALDRRAAIARGLANARPGDVVMILGRGPVTRMAYDRHSSPGFFNDREVARGLLERREASAEADRA
jgi:UDP-N-acetylmuramoylalanine--D-glutamate ligase